MAGGRLQTREAGKCSGAQKGASRLGGTHEDISLCLPGPAEAGWCTEGLPHLGGLLKHALLLDPNLCMGFQERVEKLRA